MQCMLLRCCQAPLLVGLLSEYLFVCLHDSVFLLL